MDDIHTIIHSPRAAAPDRASHGGTSRGDESVESDHLSSFGFLKKRGSRVRFGVQYSANQAHTTQVTYNRTMVVSYYYQ